MCHEARRNSPSVAVRRPTSSCIRTTSAIASSSMPRSSVSSISPAACRARASSSRSAGAGSRRGRRGTAGRRNPSWLEAWPTRPGRAARRNGGTRSPLANRRLRTCDRRAGGRGGTPNMPETQRMTGRTVLITGGTGGIGKATAIGLAAMGARVAITGHDRGRAEDAAADPRRRRPGGRGVRRGHVGSGGGAAARGRDPGGPPPARRPGQQRRGLSGTPGTSPPTGWNAPSRSTTSRRSCSPTCSSTGWWRTPPRAWSRSSSDAQRLGRIDFDDLQGERSWSGQKAYNQSKLANVLFTYELARRLRGTAVTATVLHPGIARTGFGAEDPGRIQRIITPFMRPAEVARAGRGHPDPPGLRPRGRGGQRPVLRQEHAARSPRSAATTRPTRAASGTSAPSWSASTWARPACSGAPGRVPHLRPARGSAWPW